jgi:diguanylate cyclase (GGDEF)-like protein
MGTPMDYLAVVPESAVSPAPPRALYTALGGLALICAAALVLTSLTRARHKDLHAKLEEKSRAERRLKRQAFQDQLTMLPNRLFMARHLDHALDLAGRHNTQAGVFILDLDHFKEVNDTLGHQAGDEVLRQAARRIRRAVRKSDMLGRLGGDEFLLVVENVSGRESLAGLAEKVLAAMGQPFLFDGLPVRLGVSIGIAMYPADGQDANTLIKNADLAMYQAKQSGKSRHCFFRVGLGPRRPCALPGAESPASPPFSGSWPYPAPDPGRQG